MERVNVEEVEAGDQSAEAQQSWGMLTFEGLAVGKRRVSGDL